MKESELIDAIEKLNLENINLLNSKEYKIGEEICKMKILLKQFKIITILKKFINKRKRKKINNYIDHKETENNFTYKNQNIENPKIVIYTCITGGYDKLISPLLKFDNIDYIAFTDNKEEDNKEWKIKDIPENVKKINNNVLINRYIKFHPYELFGQDYDFSIYVDGNIKIVSNLKDMIYAVNEKTGLAMHRHYLREDISNEIETCRILKKGNYEKLKEQVDNYKKEGFPDNFGMLECGVIVSHLKNKKGNEILNSWWGEFQKSESKRDQIALPYIIWKQGYKINDIGCLGLNVHKNPKIRLKLHNS